MNQDLLRKCGIDVRISDNVVIKYPELVEIGNHVAIDGPCHISTAMTIGDYVHIGPFSSIIGGKNSKCIVDDFGGLSAGCRIICGSDDYTGSGLTNPTIPAEFHADLKLTTVTIGKHAVVGTNVVVHPGVSIGEGAAIGSCSLILTDLPEWGVYIGVPTHLVRKREKTIIIAKEVKLRDSESGE